MLSLFRKFKDKKTVAAFIGDATKITLRLSSVENPHADDAEFKPQKRGQHYGQTTTKKRSAMTI